MVGGECRIVGKSCHAVARSKASIESSRQIRPDTNRIAGGKTSAARSAWCIDKVKIRIEVGDTPDSRAADEIGPAEGQLPLVEHCSRKNMVLTEGDVRLSPTFNAPQRDIAPTAPPFPTSVTVPLARVLRICWFAAVKPGGSVTVEGITPPPRITGAPFMFTKWQAAESVVS